jgi:hypothetical protein
MATDYVIWAMGQSNGPLEGRGTGGSLALNSAASFAMNNDTYRRLANDPVGLTSNNRYTTYTHTTALNSYTPALLNGLVTGGLLSAGDSVTMGGFCVGGTRATGWAASAATSPPSQSTLMGITKLRMIELFRNLTNPVLLCTIIDQGEQDADSAPNAATWDPSWTTVADAVEAFTTTMSWTWVKTLRHCVRILPDLAATGFPNWADVQTAQNTWVTNRNGGAANSTISYKPPGGETYVAVDNLHFQTASLNAIGTAIAPLILAAS